MNYIIIQFDKGTVLVMVSITVVKHFNQKCLGRNDFISFYNCSLSSRKLRPGTQIRNLKTGNYTEAKKQRYSLACSPFLLKYVFFITPRTMWLWVASPPASWIHSHKSLIKTPTTIKCTTNLYTGQSGGSTFSLRFPPPK